MRRATKMLTGIAAAGMLMGGAAVAEAVPVIFERGLPTQNLNLTVPDSQRSNIAWTGNPIGSPEGRFIGDSFLIAGSKPWIIHDFTVWSVGDNPALQFDSVSLWIGQEGNMQEVSSDFSSTQVFYPDGTESYDRRRQGVITPSDIWELTFSDLGLTVNNDEEYFFFLSTDPIPNSITLNRDELLFLHGATSDSTLSGVTWAPGSFDDQYRAFDVQGNLVATFDSDPAGTGGWSKSSDINVRITGAPIPEPMTAGLGMLALGSLAGYLARRRRPTEV